MIKCCEEKSRIITIQEGDMGKLNLDYDNNSSNTQLNDEIYELFEELKILEKKFEIFEIKKIEEKEDLIQVETENLEEFLPIEDVEEIKKSIFKHKIKKLEPKSEIKIEKIKKPIDPVTFRFRYNNEGKFENIDLKKRNLKTKSKKRFILNRIKIRKKEKYLSGETEEKSKFSRLKKVLVKLKRVIPNKSIEVEKTEEIAKEE